MRAPRYFPVVDIDTHGKWMVSMFATTDKRAADERYTAYLEEITPRAFRLITRKTMTRDNVIGCPYCGKKLECVVHANEGVEHSYYRCSCSA